MKFKKILITSLPLLSIGSMIGCNNSANASHNVTLIAHGAGVSITGKETTTPNEEYIATISYEQGFTFGKIKVIVGSTILNAGSEYSLSVNNTKLFIYTQFITDDILIEVSADIQWDYNQKRFQRNYWTWTENGDYKADIQYYSDSAFEKVWIIKNKITPGDAPADDDILFYAKYNDSDFNEKILQYFTDKTCTSLTIPANIFKENPIVAIRITCRDK